MSEQTDLHVAIHPGDIVRLKSGGPDMTVVASEKDIWWFCMWDDGHGKAAGDFFLTETLDLVCAGSDVGCVYHYHLNSSPSLGINKHVDGVVSTATPINTAERWRALRERIARELGIDPDFSITSFTLLNP